MHKYLWIPTWIVSSYVYLDPKCCFFYLFTSELKKILDTGEHLFKFSNLLVCVIDIFLDGINLTLNSMVQWMINKVAKLWNNIAFWHGVLFDVNMMSFDDFILALKFVSFTTTTSAFFVSCATIYIIWISSSIVNTCLYII